MKIEISTGEDYPISVPNGLDEKGNVQYIEDIDTVFEHEGYYDTIDEAIKALQRLKTQFEESAQPRCDKCVYIPYTCGLTDKNGKCPAYKRDPPDGGYYG